MKRIVIAYHGYMYGDHYMEIMLEQFRKIVNAKFFKDMTFEDNLFHYCHKMYIGIADCVHKKPAHGIEWLKKFWSFSSSKENEKMISNVELVFYTKNNEEADTMKWIRDYAQQNPDDYILYFHSKGVTRNTPASTDWRHYMEYFVIENWRDCVKKLDEGYDCCGVMWNKDTPLGYHPHFSGTFWWAKANYINTLDHSYLSSKRREDREFWIGTNKNVKPFEFHNSGLNTKERLLAETGHYNVVYPRWYYEKPEPIDITVSPNNDKMILQVVCTVFKRAITLRRLIDCFILQTNPRWTLRVLHDGPATKEVQSVMSLYQDQRITFSETKTVNGSWGFPNRRLALKEMPLNHRDFILFTNDDNMYVPGFVEQFLRECSHQNTGFVYCNTIHSYMKYDVLYTEIRQNYIDMGSFAVKLDVAKKVGFSEIHEAADGKYAEECAELCKLRKLKAIRINKCLFIHC